MIEQILGLPDNVIGVHAKGKITGEDYEKVMIPLVEKRIKDQGKIAFLYVIESKMSDFTGQAMWDDAKCGMKHIFQFTKIGVVSDDPIMQKTTRIMGHLMPAEVKVFSMDKIDDAKEWIIA